MSDQVTNKSAAAEQTQERLQEMAPPSSISSSDKLLSRIAILLFILVAGLLTVFGYYASLICITVVLAGFLAVLFDPLVVKLERLHIPRSVAAAGIVLAGIGLIGLLGYAVYGRAMSWRKNFQSTPRRFSKPLSPLAGRSKTFNKVRETLRTTFIPAAPVLSRTIGFTCCSWRALCRESAKISSPVRIPLIPS